MFTHFIKFELGVEYIFGGKKDHEQSHGKVIQVDAY